MSKVKAQLKKTLVVRPQDFPRIAVNALKTLAYRSELHDKHDDKIIYVDHCSVTYGTETWNCIYQAVLTWLELAQGIELTIEVQEKNYGDAHIEDCIDRLKDIWTEICRIVERSKTIKPKDVPYKAKFAELADLESAGYVLEGNQNNANNFVLGLFDKRKLSLPERVTHRHVLVCGPTGSGKSMSIFTPNLIERTNTSAIVTEAVSGNMPPVLYSSTAGWRAKAGHEIIYFNPSDLRSSRINPIDQVKCFDDAQHLARLIVTNTTAESHMGDQIWSQSETHLLQSLLLHVAGFRRDINKPSEIGDNANIGYIRRLLTKGPLGMEEELKQTQLSLARQEYFAYLNCTSPNFRYGVMSGLMMRLNLFVSPTVASLTEVTDFAIDQLKDKLFTIYLATPVHLSEYTPLAVMLFNFSLSVVLRDLERFKYPLTIIADEFTNFGYLPDMPRYLTVIRNAGIGVALGIQDPVQLERVYREKDARILFGQPRTKIFFAPADDIVAVRLSKMLGTKTEKEDVSASGQLSNREVPRPLMDASELMQLEREQKYICLTATETIKLDCMKSWEIYKEQINIKPPERPPILVNEQIDRTEANIPPPWIKISTSERPSNKVDIEHKVNRQQTVKKEESYWDRLETMADEENYEDNYDG